MIGLLLLAVVGQSSPIQNNPAFQALKGLAGSWEGVVEKNVKVTFKFSIQQGGSMIVGDGLINAGAAHPLTAHTSLGWDADAKQVYYLDQHGFDTVYFGHVTKQGDELIWDFKGLVGDKGHYRSTERITSDTYESSMSAEQDGKWKDLGFHLKLHRVAD